MSVHKNNNLTSDTINQYKKYSKSGIYKVGLQMYNEKNLVELAKVCKLYLDYFEFTDDDDLHLMKFYLGFALFNTNKEKAMKHFEQLYNNKKVKNDLQKYVKGNLEKMYQKNNGKIPKIIHFIYFKEKPLQHFNYCCIKSVLDNMTDYVINIYNDIEPIDCPIWKKIVENSRINIVKYERPTEFDGFPIDNVQYAADIARLEILYKYGGIYLDNDMLIIKNFENLIDKKDFYISRETRGNGALINSFLAAKPENGFIKLWLESFKIGIRMESWAYHINQHNKKMIEENKHYMIKYNIEILESKYFFPFSWTERRKFENIKENLNKNIYGIHLFENILNDLLIENKYFSEKKNNISLTIKNI